MLISMLLEMLSIGALIPLLMIILDKDFVLNYNEQLEFFNLLELSTQF